MIITMIYRWHGSFARSKDLNEMFHQNNNLDCAIQAQRKKIITTTITVIMIIIIIILASTKESRLLTSQFSLFCFKLCTCLSIDSIQF